MRAHQSSTPAQFEQILSAAKEFLGLKERKTHPVGCRDKSGRWHPDDSERQACCSFIRQPSRSWPNSLQAHCRTAEHVAEKHGVSASDVRKAAHLLKKQEGGAL